MMILLFGYDITPRLINFEDSICNICQNVGKASFLCLTQLHKVNECVEHQMAIL